MKEVKETEVKATDKLIEKVLLLSNLSELDKYKTKITRKKDLFDEVKKYCESYLPIQDLKQFNESFLEYFKKSFIKKYRDSFPTIVSDAKMFEMSDVQLSKIEYLEAKYKDIEVEEFDFIQGKGKFIDFGLYAQTPQQIERYYEVIGLVTHLNHLIEHFPQGSNPRHALCQFLKVAYYNDMKHCFAINHHYVLKGI